MSIYRKDFATGEQIRHEEINYNFDAIQNSMFIFGETPTQVSANPAIFTTATLFVDTKISVFISGVLQAPVAYVLSLNNTITFPGPIGGPVLVNYIKLQP